MPSECLFNAPHDPCMHYELTYCFIFAAPHGPCMHHELSYCFIYALGFVSLFGISDTSEAKSKYVHGAIPFLGI